MIFFPTSNPPLQQPGAQRWEEQTVSASQFTSGPQRDGASQLRLRWLRPLTVRHTDTLLRSNVKSQSTPGFTLFYFLFFCIYGLFPETQVQTFSTLGSCSTVCHYRSLSGSSCVRFPSFSGKKTDMSTGWWYLMVRWYKKRSQYIKQYSK